MQRWLQFFIEPIWNSQHNSGTWFDTIYPVFNVAEAVCWFVVAALVLRRSLKRNGKRDEFVYAVLWLVFGLTDLREAYVQQMGLIAFKGIVLGALLLLRRRVLPRYPGTKAF